MCTSWYLPPSAVCIMYIQCTNTFEIVPAYSGGIIQVIDACFKLSEELMFERNLLTQEFHHLTVLSNIGIYYYVIAQRYRDALFWVHGVCNCGKRANNDAILYLHYNNYYYFLTLLLLLLT